MRMNLCTMCLMMVAAVLEAQPGGLQAGRTGGSGGSIVGAGVVGMIRGEAVQKELELSPKAIVQVKAITDELESVIRESVLSRQGGVMSLQGMTPPERAAAMAKMFEKRNAAAAELAPKLKQVLTISQFNRLQQITWQSVGLGALSDPELAKAIQLSTEQQDSIRAINREHAEKKNELNKNIGPAQPAEGPGKLQEQNKELDDERISRINQVLTKAQQEQLETLKGKPFDLSKLGVFSLGGRGGSFPAALHRFGGLSRGSGDAEIIKLVVDESVQKELNLTPEASRKLTVVSGEFNSTVNDAVNSVIKDAGNIADMTPEQQTTMQSKMAEVRRSVADQFSLKVKDIATAEQFTRLQQIHWQIMGATALLNADLARAIPLSKEQQAEINSINSEYSARRVVPLITSRDGERMDPAAVVRIQMQNEKLDKERDARMMEVLTKHQQERDR